MLHRTPCVHRCSLHLCRYLYPFVFIALLQGASLREDCAMLVTEYCEGGNLARNIVARKVNWYRRGRKVRARAGEGGAALERQRRWDAAAMLLG